MNNFTNPTDAMTAMFADLNNSNSALRKNVVSAETASRLAESLKTSLEQRKVAATELIASKAGTSSTS
jgi:hypothetical protein